MAIATLTSVSPTTPPANGGSVVVFTGVGYTGTTAVTVNGSAATFVVTNDTTLTVTLPNGVAGPATVTVTNGSGTLTDTTHLTLGAYNVPTRMSIVQLTGVFDTSGTTRFTNNIADQYAAEETSLFGGSYPTSYPQYLVRAAKIKAVNLFNVRYPSQSIAPLSF